MYKEMTILIYIASLEHLEHTYEMDKIKIMGFHQPPTIIFDEPPYPNDTHKLHLITSKDA